MPISKHEALLRLSIARERCHRGDIPLSEETAHGLGTKKKSLSVEEADELLEGFSRVATEENNGSVSDPEPQKPRRVRSAKAETESEETSKDVL